MSAQLADDELLITREIDAPADIVFSMWTNPEHFKQWMGPGKYECRAIDMDVRVGGAYRGMIYSDDTGDGWFGGVYREIVPNQRLVFTWKWDSGPSGELESLVTITFEERDGKTTQLFHQTPFLSIERRDAHVGGWTSAFNKLAAYAAKQQEQTS